MDNENKLLFNKLKPFLSDSESINKDIIENIVVTNDEILVKQKKCKVCNKKYNGHNRFYGSTCVKNLYSNSDVIYSKEIDDKELFLHSAIILRLRKLDLSKKEMSYICESYFSRLYFQKLKYPKTRIIEQELDKCIDDNSKPIMKLNTAYRLTNILKRNKKILNKKELDKVIDENILKFFKTYFTLGKINDRFNYQVYYYMQLLFWEIVILGGTFLNYKLASKCLKNALCVIGENSKDINITNKEEDIISEIKEENGLELKIKDLIKNNVENDNIEVSENNYSYEFSNSDLLYSLHKVNLSFKGTKKNNKWNLKITLTDRYNFTEILSNDIFTKQSNNYLKLPTILNDMAAISTQYGVLQEYNIRINFDWNIIDE